MTPLDYYLRGGVKDKCYAGKPEICEIQLNTIDNVLKNWTDRVGYCMARMKLFAIINRKDCTFKTVIGPS